MNGTILIALIILGLIGLAVFFSYSIVVKNDLKITYEEKLDNRVFGLDIDKNFLLVYDFTTIVKDIV